MNPNDHIDSLLVRLTGAIASGDLKAVVDIVENEPEESVRKAAGRLAPGITSEKLTAGREFIFGLLAEKSNQRLRDSLTDVGKKVSFLAEGLDAVVGSIEKLNESSGRVARKGLWIAALAGIFALVQVIAGAVQIYIAVRSPSRPVPAGAASTGGAPRT